ncbi:MAG: hypothetical protein Sw2LagBPW_14220 [Shewanella algae]
MLSQELALPLEDSLLLRIADTAPQAGLSGKARRRNLAKAFAVSGAPKWQRLVLVDDVVTTGTTIREAAKALAPWSPDVQVWCLARAEAPGLNHIAPERLKAVSMVPTKDQDPAWNCGR